MNDSIMNLYIGTYSIPLAQGTMVGGLQLNSPLGGSFFGVLLAFAFNYAYQSYRSLQDYIHHKKFIKAELDLCVERLGRTGDLLPMDRWTSALNSGALRLFTIDEADELSRAYEGIRNYNYEAKRTRDASEDWQRNPENIDLLARWGAYSSRLSRIRDPLLNNLQELLGKTWLNQIIIKADEAGAYLSPKGKN